MLQALAADGGFLCDEDLEQRNGCKGRDLRDHYVWNVAQREPERSPPAKSNKRQREPLLPGNVWAHACCGVQVAAQSYHDTKGCQGEAAVACKKRLDALTEAPRGRRKTQKTSGK